MPSPVIVSAITDVKSARRALAYFRRRSLVGKIARDGTCKLELFVPFCWTPERALAELAQQLPLTAKCFVEPGPPARAPGIVIDMPARD